MEAAALLVSTLLLADARPAAGALPDGTAGRAAEGRRLAISAADDEGMFDDDDVVDGVADVEDEDEDEDEDGDGDGAFRLDVAIDLWMPRLEGDFTDAGAEIDVRDADVHDTEAVFSGALALTRDRVKVELRGFSFATEGADTAAEAFTLGGLAVAAGDAFDSSFSWWSAGAEVSYEFLRPHRNASNGTDFSLFLLASLDVQSVTRDIANLTTGAPPATAREAFLAAEFGGGFRLAFDARPGFPVFRRAEVSAKASAGASLPMGDGDFGSAARVEARFTGWITPDLAVYGGYRLVGASLSGEELEMSTSLQGLMAGFRYEF